MQDYRFIQAALLAAQQEPNRSLALAIYSLTGSGLQIRHDGVEPLNKVSTRPVQIAQGEERQAEKTAEFTESAETEEKNEESVHRVRRDRSHQGRF